jgi:predicted permease
MLALLLPSSWLRGLCARVLPPADQHALGDLDEEFRERVLRDRRRAAAELWYVREASPLLVAAAAGRVLFDRSTAVAIHELGSGGGSMRGTTRDFVHALRALRREPATTVVIGLTLALAVGATTAIFGVANAAFLRPLPYPDADRLVRIYTGSREDPAVAFAVSPLDWRDFDGFAEVVEESAVWTLGESVHLASAAEPVRLEAPRASAGLFPLLGAEPALGRFFTTDEETPGRDDAVVLSHGLWDRAFGRDPEVIGRTIELDDRTYRIVGVAPADGVLPRDADLWRSLALGPEWYEDARWGWQFLAAVARLTPGTGPAVATRALDARLRVVNPDRADRLGQTRVVRSMYAERSAESGSAILMLLAAVALVLAMACVNVMNVMRARSDARLREFALRRALGSGAGSLARLVLLETLVLASVGTVGGLGLAQLALLWVESTDVAPLAALGSLGVDARVLAFGAFLTVTTAGLFGAAPVVDALRADPHAVLTETSGRGGGSRGAARLRDGLVAFQVTLAVTLLVAVALTAGAFSRLIESDPGFDPTGVLTVTIELPREDAGSGTGAAVASSETYRSLLERIGSVPGVVSAGATNFLPLEGVGWSSSFELIEPDPGVTDPDPGGNMRAVSAGYFVTVGIPVLEGRPFDDGDALGAPPVAIVDETISRRYWPAGSPVGREAVIGGLSGRPATIVGVVGDVPDESLDRPGAGHVYFPVVQSPQRRTTLVLRTDGDPTGLVAPVRNAIHAVDPRIPLTDVSMLETRVGGSLSGLRVSVLILGAFGAAAALLAALGIYGVLAYSVARRRGEIGIRMALGAAPRLVFGGVVAHAMKLWLLGAAVGVAGSAGMARVLSRYVVGVEPGSVPAYAVALAVLGIVALLSAALPAGRAVGVDPAESLRVE